MTDVGLRPLDDRVIVEPRDAEAVTPGGIVLPDNAKEESTYGKVLRVGPGKLNSSLDSDDFRLFGETKRPARRHKLSVAVGDEVLYAKYAGSAIEIDGRTVKILRESDVLAVVEGGAEK